MSLDFVFAGLISYPHCEYYGAIKAAEIAIDRGKSEGSASAFEGWRGRRDCLPVGNNGRVAVSQSVSQSMIPDVILASGRRIVRRSRLMKIDADVARDIRSRFNLGLIIKSISRREDFADLTFFPFLFCNRIEVFGRVRASRGELVS